MRFEASETEAILFSRRQKHRQCKREIRVGGHRARFNLEATLWLGIWLDSTLNLAENRKRWIRKTRQARFAQRLHARPRGGQGPEDILARKGSALTARIQAAAAIRREGTVEAQEWGSGCRFPGRIIIEERVAVLQTTNEWRRRDTVQTDGSRQDDGKAEAACV